MCDHPRAVVEGVQGLPLGHDACALLDQAECGVVRGGLETVVLNGMRTGRESAVCGSLELRSLAMTPKSPRFHGGPARRSATTTRDGTGVRHRSMRVAAMHVADGPTHRLLSQTSRGGPSAKHHAFRAKLLAPV